MDADGLAGLIPDGALLALPPDNSLAPCALAHALVRRGVRRLRLVGVPVGGYAMDLLIGAGCVASVMTSAVTLGESGHGAAASSRAVAAGTIEVHRRDLSGHPHGACRPPRRGCRSCRSGA